MNDALQTGLTWLGVFSALCCGSFAIYLGIAIGYDGRRFKAQRAALRARRSPITEHEIAAVDFDAELAKLTKENGR